MELRLPKGLADAPAPRTITFPNDIDIASIGDLLGVLKVREPEVHEELAAMDSVFSLVVNGHVVMSNLEGQPLKAGDVIEAMPFVSGG